MVTPFVLASGSPRRKDLLEGLGYRFVVRPASIDERPRPGEPPRDYVARLAREKALADRHMHDDDPRVVLAADTIVALGDTLLGKPSDDDDAVRMLRGLSGREHEVMTGVAVQRGKPFGAGAAIAVEVEVVATRVAFQALDEATIRDYVATGEPHGKAGAYAIQGIAAAFIESIDGNYPNVVGLPLPTAVRMLEAAGIPLAMRPSPEDP